MNHVFCNIITFIIIVTICLSPRTARQESLLHASPPHERAEGIQHLNDITTTEPIQVTGGSDFHCVEVTSYVYLCGEESAYTILYVHHTVRTPYCTYTILYIHHTVRTPYCTYTILYVHHTVRTPYCTYTILYIHHTVHTPYCTYTILYIHHTVHTPYCTYTILYVHHTVHTLCPSYVSRNCSL